MNFFLKAVWVAVAAVSLVGAETPNPKIEPVVILGGGIGALTSSLYLARAGVEPLVVVGKRPGGLLTQSHTVQNWPGEMEIDGTALTEKVRAQAEANGSRFLAEEVVKVDFSQRPFLIQTASLTNGKELHEIRAEAVIVAMGTEPNFLGIPGEQGPGGYWARGVTNCAICDGNLYRGKKVGVVGGGDAAVLEALYLSNIAKEVAVFVRKDRFKAVEEKRLAALLAQPNVKIFYNTSLEEIQGDQEGVTQVVAKTKNKKPATVPLDGLFLAIGSRPNTALFQGSLELDQRGYIALKRDQQTSVEGVYAIGDIVDPIYKQAISAAGDGAKAALQAQQYVAERISNRMAQAKQSPTPSVAQRREEVLEVTSRAELDREIKSAEGPVVIDFYATWCGPCKRLSPLFESSAHELSGKVKFLKVNVDTCRDLSSSYKIRSMPTVLVLNSSGEEVDRKVGTEEIGHLLEGLQGMR